MVTVSLKFSVLHSLTLFYVFENCISFWFLTLQKKPPNVCVTFPGLKKEMFHEEQLEGTHCCDTGVLALF